ncbi:LacI family DNA-binding transcriptional regulator [Nonomuraea sp. NPDC059194]|uniref:LacI family DNA-binding transcriptional regulator n=1 Tax=Nonomuraea sp. NPDC059194 TaxID=3346764 RepID=UPI0036B09D43
MIVTIREVAAHAEVSVSTASRALSGRRKVSPEIVARVVAAAEHLGYRPNAIAQALRDQTTRTVGMVVPSITIPFFPEIVQAVEFELQRSGRELILCDSQYDPDIEARRLRVLIERKVDGLIISPCHLERSRTAVAEAARAVPLVQLDRYVEGGVTDWVGVDDETGITLVVNHVIAGGARDLVFVGSELDNSSARLRLAAFERSARAGGARIADVLLGEFSVAWGQQAAERLHSDGRLPDAVICGNDEIALSLLRGLRSHGVRVPDDVAITGFDDIGYAQLSHPALTTVRQPREQLAHEALRVLTEARSGHSSRRIAIAPQLVVRETTRPEGPS